MDPIQTLYFIATNLLTVTPQLLVFLFGIILCISKWSNTPKASKMAFIGIVIMFLMTLAGVIFSVIQFQLAFWSSDFIQSSAYINVGVRSVLSILWSVGLGLLIYAVWIGREKS